MGNGHVKEEAPKDPSPTMAPQAQPETAEPDQDILWADNNGNKGGA